MMKRFFKQWVFSEPHFPLPSTLGTDHNKWYVYSPTNMEGRSESRSSLPTTKTFSPIVIWDEELNNTHDVSAVLICYAVFIDSYRVTYRGLGTALQSHLQGSSINDCFSRTSRRGRVQRSKKIPLPLPIIETRIPGHPARNKFFSAIVGSLTYNVCAWYVTELCPAW
jgi:hypothetical protein